MRHFLNEYNRAATTPVVGLLAPMSQPSCKSCSGLEEDIQALLDDREKYLVSPLRIDGVTCVACGPEQDPEWYVHVWVFSRPAKIADVHGKPVQTMKSSTDVLHFGLEWRAAGWSVTKIMVVK